MMWCSALAVLATQLLHQALEDGHLLDELAMHSLLSHAAAGGEINAVLQHHLALLVNALAQVHFRKEPGSDAFQ